MNSQSEKVEIAEKIEKFGPTGKRLDYLTWHQHHMYMATMLGENGCYIVDQEHYQIASGSSEETPKITDPSSCRCSVSVALQKMEKIQKSAENLVMYLRKFPECSECVEKIQKAKFSKIWILENGKMEIPEDLRCEKYVPTRRIEIEF